MTKKEWLHKVHGIGKGGGKGRISLEGHRLIAEAIANGMVFDEPASVIAATAKKNPKPKAEPKPEKPVITEDYNAAEVRKWAEANGHKVAARGRIDATVVRAYLDAIPEAERGSRDDSGKDLRESAPRRFPEGTTFTVSFTDIYGKHSTITVNDRTACRGCKVSLSGCLCAVPGPVAIGYEDTSMPVTVVANLPRV